MIQFKLSQLNSIITTFNHFANQNLPVQLSYQIAKIMIKLEEETQSFEYAKNSLFKKYAERNEDGSLVLNEEGQIVVPKESEEEFLREMQDLLDLEVTLECEKISLSQLNETGISISPLEMAAIEPFIENDLI